MCLESPNLQGTGAGRKGWESGDKGKSKVREAGDFDTPVSPPQLICALNIHVHLYMLFF